MVKNTNYKCRQCRQFKNRPNYSSLSIIGIPLLPNRSVVIREVSYERPLFTVPAAKIFYPFYRGVFSIVSFKSQSSIIFKTMCCVHSYKCTVSTMYIGSATISAFVFSYVNHMYIFVSTLTNLFIYHHLLILYHSDSCHRGSWPQECHHAGLPTGRTDVAVTSP